MTDRKISYRIERHKTKRNNCFYMGAGRSIIELKDYMIIRKTKAYVEEDLL